MKEGKLSKLNRPVQRLVTLEISSCMGEAKGEGMKKDEETVVEEPMRKERVRRAAVLDTAWKTKNMLDS